MEQNKNLETKQKEIKELINRKIQELQNIENMRNQLTNEIVKMQGKEEMLKELIDGKKEMDKSISNEVHQGAQAKE